MTDLLEHAEVTATPTPEDPCPCGSGLTGRNCCALTADRVDRGTDGQFDESLKRLEVAQAEGDKALARSIATDILEAAPGQRDALLALYELLAENPANTNAAAAVINRVAQLHPNDANLRATAAQFFVAHGHASGAQTHARMLIRLAPLSHIAHRTMGGAFLLIQNGQAAEHHLRRALELGRDRRFTAMVIDERTATDIEVALGQALHQQGRIAEARALFEDVIARTGPQLGVFLFWARMEEADRQFDAAEKLLDRAEALAPADRTIAMQRAGLLHRRKQPESALAVLEAVAQDRGEDGQELIDKGRLLDSLGRYDEAFAAFAKFKQRLREHGHGYRAEEAKKQVEALKGFFTASRSAMLPRAGRRNGTPQPIFIVGFPRSGTTLVEQTLTAHGRIAAGDELRLIHEIADRSQMMLGSPGRYPLSLSELWIGDRAGLVETLRDDYLNEALRIGAADPGKRWFTDKMPLNETHLGLIHLLFPEAPIVHLVRHPLDVVLSVFSNTLTHGFNCASALETAAEHYALIADLIAHYREALPLRYHAVRYEDLVAEQEREVRALFGFIGEAYDPAALAFHENPRYARTASYAQVKEPLYASSVHRYRNYLKHLEPVIPILTPAIERLGYTVEGSP
jgi:tetratricopeptide (TPR) repeat protein